MLLTFMMGFTNEHQTNLIMIFAPKSVPPLEAVIALLLIIEIIPGLVLDHIVTK